ncbi:MAG: hypothetical protein HLUCCA11_07655 [Phormidesmis priestleyi Ana]|uniref:Uncharacterized protein n=1 Tax=Phormidesmis priestleyi Ana TaxID=1666911 RepID=A0A0P8C3I3_9CYAN|nr:MAG: hypothetical protein HLUCCA11_07655 [Phormidesmis priestleyi Ana]
MKLTIKPSTCTRPPAPELGGDREFEILRSPFQKAVEPLASEPQSWGWGHPGR